MTPQTSDQEIRLPLNDFVRSVAREAAIAVLADHQEKCPAINNLPVVIERVQKLEIRLSSLIAFMAGSGMLGGIAGALAARLIGT